MAVAPKPIMPAPPGRLSTNTCWPSSSPSRGAEDARGDVGDAAGAVRHDQPDRPVRKILRLRLRIASAHSSKRAEHRCSMPRMASSRAGCVRRSAAALPSVRRSNFPAAASAATGSRAASQAVAQIDDQAGRPNSACRPARIAWVGSCEQPMNSASQSGPMVARARSRTSFGGDAPERDDVRRAERVHAHHADAAVGEECRELRVHRRPGRA